MINPEIRAEILFQIVSYLLKGEIVSPQIASQNQALQSSAKCKLWHLWWHIVRFLTQVSWYNTNVCDHTVCQREGDLEAMRTLVHNKCSNIKWLSAVFVVIGRITYKIWTLSRQAKLTKKFQCKITRCIFGDMQNLTSSSLFTASVPKTKSSISRLASGMLTRTETNVQQHVE